jgi:hypothetical protein
VPVRGCDTCKRWTAFPASYGGHVLLLIAAMAFSRPAAGETPYCPDGIRLLHHGGVLSPDGTPTQVPVTMFPCETFEVKVTFSEGDPLGGKHGSVQLVNGTSWHSNLFFVEGSATADLPLREEGRGFPWPGTLGPNGVITAINVWGGTNDERYPVSFGLEIRLVPRLGFNTAGLSFGDARRISNGETLLMTLTSHHLQAGPYYYRLRLAGGGKLELHGSILDLDRAFWGNIRVYLYDENKRFITKRIT